MTETAANTGMVLNLALSYGGRGEILEAIKRLSAAGGLTGDLTEEAFSAHLDTAGLPDPDLIIRTSGEKRISNFLLWQAAYAELYFTDILWPDFERRRSAARFPRLPGASAALWTHPGAAGAQVAAVSQIRQ